MTEPLPVVNRHCPYCGGMVAPKIEFCTHCGSDLPPEPPDAPWLTVSKDGRTKDPALIPLPAGEG